MASELSSGLDDSLEQALKEGPSDKWRFAENFLFAAFDPESGIGLWTHLGTWPDDFGLWEDQLLCSLPGDEGVLTSFSYHRTAPDQRPAGSNLVYRCVEPFRRWKVTFDGVVVRSSYDEMRAGLLADGPKERLSIELDIECVTPAWDPAGAGHSAAAAMSDQSWASQHYQQSLRATGRVQLEDRTVEFRGSGTRDHSRGQRGHATEHFGGHTMIGAAFPSGRAFGLMRMWDPRGGVNLDVGYVVEDGVLQPAEVVEAPRLGAGLQLRDEKLSIVLRTPQGEHELHGTTAATTVATALPRLGMAFGASTQGDLTVFAQTFARWEWDGETAYGLTERSDRRANLDQAP
jgi:hypothetical protein